MTSSVARPLRVALVGCGQIADAHLHAARRTGVATLVGVCDWSLDLAEQAALRFGVPRHDCDFGRLLDATRPDVVHVTTPPASHLALVEQAIEAGAHVYVEKPFALDAAETDAMLALAEKRQRLVCVGHDRLFDPAWLEGLSLLDAGAIGRLAHVEVFQAYDLDGPFGRLLVEDDEHWVRRLRGGLFQNTIPHGLAAVAELVSDDTPAVSGISWRRSYDFDSELHVVVRGAERTATLAFVTTARPAGMFVRLYGTGGWIEIDYEARTTRRRSAAALPSLATKLHAPWTASRQAAAALARNASRLLRGDLHYFAGMQQLCRLFYRAILDRREPPLGPAHIRRVARLADAVIDALAAPKERAVEYNAT